MIFSFPQKERCNLKVGSGIILAEKNMLSSNCIFAIKTQATQASKNDLISQRQLQLEKENIPQSLRDLKDKSIKAIIKENNKIEQMQKSCFALQDKFYFCQQAFESNKTNYESIIRQLRKQLSSVKQLAKIEKNKCLLELQRKNSHINTLEKQLCYARNKLITTQDYSQRLKKTFKQLKTENSQQINRIQNGQRQLLKRANEKIIFDKSIQDLQLQEKSDDIFIEEQNLSELKQKISQRKIQTIQQTIQFKQFYQKQLSTLKSQYFQKEKHSQFKSQLQKQQSKSQLDIQSNIDKSEIVNLKSDLAKVGIQEFSFQSFSPEKMSQNSSKAIQGFSITNLLIQHALETSLSKIQSNLSQNSSQYRPRKNNNCIGFAIFGFGFLAGGIIYTFLNKYFNKK